MLTCPHSLARSQVVQYHTTHLRRTQRRDLIRCWVTRDADPFAQPRSDVRVQHLRQTRLSVRQSPSKQRGRHQPPRPSRFVLAQQYTVAPSNLLLVMAASQHFPSVRRKQVHMCCTYVRTCRPVPALMSRCRRSRAWEPENLACR